jgi:hypothetical protein
MQGTKITDKIRLTKDVVFDEFTNSVGFKIMLAEVRGDMLMTADEMARLYRVRRPTITRHLLKLLPLTTSNVRQLVPFNPPCGGRQVIRNSVLQLGGNHCRRAVVKIPASSSVSGVGGG